MSADRSDDELARTATAHGATTARRGEAAPLGDSLGRYRLQHELGAGGMGVVHAAFDPDLERRIALKVLKTAGGLEARQRLLREARAMARLAHPNVVTVHEVGSAGGRDFIAMELIDGETLEDWLRAEPRRDRDIIAAFVAAGRGLAAAHAAGLVHRDFKPRNVLRQKDGRIVVTDFGLVIGVENQAAVALESTMRLDEKPSEDTPSSLSGLTKTGSVLGTPAYMAPEQWAGAAVGPKADQFAFCIALWEALAGERPFYGATLDELKASVAAGPVKADASKLPRRLRKPLRRGLDPDPAKRWPSMNALLGAITRRESRPGVALAIGSGALVLAGLAVAVFARGDEGPTCEAPVRDPALVWSAGRAAKLRAAKQGPTADAIDADIAAWKQARERACAAPAGSREPRLACLDGVLARMNLVATAVERVEDAPNLDTGDMLVAPAVCESARPPRLVHAVPDLLVEVYVAHLERSRSRKQTTKEEAQALIAKAAGEPCAAAFANTFGLSQLLTTERVAQLDEGERAAQRCGDDRVVADIALSAAMWALRDRTLDAQAPSKLRRAETAVEKVSQPDLDADLDMMRAELAARNDRLDDAITWTEKAIKGYTSRHRTRMAITAGMTSLGFRELRARDEDLATIRSRLSELRDQSAAAFGDSDRQVKAIDGQLAYDEMAAGNVASAHAKLEALRDPAPLENPVKVTGRVVDEQGNPVAGAFVAGSNDAYGDSISVMVPNDNERRTTSAADGTFVLPEVSSDGVVIAQLGELRSAAQLVAESVTLTLRPTSRIEGKVELNGQPARSVIVAVRDPRLSITVPYVTYTTLASDGTFVLDGVPRGKVVIQTALSRGVTTRVINGTELVVDKPVVKGVALELKSSKRQVHVIVRSQYGVEVPAAQVVVLPGRVATQSALEINERLRTAAVRMGAPILGEQAPRAVLAKAKLRDLYATMTEVPEGEASACALGLPKDMDPEMGKRLQNPENLAKITVTCVRIAPTDEVVVVEVVPWPRFD